MKKSLMERSIGEGLLVAAGFVLILSVIDWLMVKVEIRHQMFFIPLFLAGAALFVMGYLRKKRIAGYWKKKGL